MANQSPSFSQLPRTDQGIQTPDNLQNPPSLESIAQTIVDEQRRRENDILARIDHNRTVNSYSGTR